MFPLPGSPWSPLEQVVTRYARMVRGVGRERGLTEGEIGELLQDVRIRLWRALGSDEKIAAAPCSYIYRTAETAALDLVRHRRMHRERSLDPQLAAGRSGIPVPPPPDSVLERRELGRRIREAVARIREPRHTAVVAYLAGYAHDEVALLYGWSEAKARNLVYRGLAEVRGILTRWGVGPDATEPYRTDGSRCAGQPGPSGRPHSNQTHHLPPGGHLKRRSREAATGPGFPG